MKAFLSSPIIARCLAYNHLLKLITLTIMAIDKNMDFLIVKPCTFWEKIYKLSIFIENSWRQMCLHWLTWIFCLGLGIVFYFFVYRILICQLEPRKWKVYTISVDLLSRVNYSFASLIWCLPISKYLVFPMFILSQYPYNFFLK